MIFPDDIAVVHLSHVPQQRMRSGARCDGNPLNVLDRGHLRLGNLHLDLISDTGFRVSPVIGNDKPARRRCGEERAAYAGCGHSQLPGTFPVNVDVHARIVERFVVLKVAECVNLGEFAANLFGERPARPKVRPTHVDFHWSRSAEIHDLRHDVRRFERKLAAWKL